MLPTEARWEYAAWAATGTVWSFGNDVRAMPRFANVLDRATLGQTGFAGMLGSDGEPWCDGHGSHAPVGSFAPNPFGLHDVHDNVYEWVREVIQTYDHPMRASDGLRLGAASGDAVVARGGSFMRRARSARCAARPDTDPMVRIVEVGVRPARALDPHPSR